MKMFKMLKHELCDDLWGVHFAGYDRCESISQECTQQGQNALGNIFDSIVSDENQQLDKIPSEAAHIMHTLHHDSRTPFMTSLLVVCVYAGCFGQRDIMKACTCGTDAMRFAVSCIVSGSKDVCAVGVYNYVGGDADLVPLSTISRHNDAGHRPDGVLFVPLPYVPTHNDRNLELETWCLQYILRLSIRCKLEGNPLRGLSFELVLAYSGLLLPQGFLHRLLPFLRKLSITIIVDETMTAARCSGDAHASTRMIPSCCAHLCIVSSGYHNNSVLLIDKWFAGVIGYPHYVIVGKIFGCGFVLSSPHNKRPPASVRGTSTGLGTLRLQIAGVIATELMVVATPERIHGIRSAYQDLIRKSNSKAKFWGEGLMIFSTSRLQIQRVDPHQPHRLLPTVAVDASRCAP